MKNKGITLVALVITIIILLILAGITISQLTESNLFENSKLAKEKYENSQAKEDDMLKQYENAMNGGKISSDRDIDIQQLKNQIKQELIQEISTNTDTSNDYSTTEKRIGTWTDGKPLYQKTFTKTFSTTNAIENGSNIYCSNVTISDVCPNIDYGFFVKDMSYYLNTRGFVAGWYERDDTNLFIMTLYSRTNETGTFTVRYTKTTDTAVQ